MTIESDDVHRFKAAYLDYLEGDRDEPPALEDLRGEKRRAAEAFIESITAARGVDPYASRPSIEQLLAWRSQTNDRTVEFGEALQDHLRLTVDPRASVTADVAFGCDWAGFCLGDPGPWYAYPRRIGNEFGESRVRHHQEGRRHRQGVQCFS